MSVTIQRIPPGVSGFASLPVYRVQLRHCMRRQSTKQVNVYASDSEDAMTRALHVVGLSYVAERADAVTLPDYGGLLP